MVLNYAVARLGGTGFEKSCHNTRTEFNITARNPIFLAHFKECGLLLENSTSMQHRNLINIHM